MEEKIYNVLLDILEELKTLNKRRKLDKALSDDEKIDRFVHFILNFKYDGISKSDLRATKICSSSEFKGFFDNNLEVIINIMKTRHKIFLSRCVKGYYLYKKPYNK